MPTPWRARSPYTRRASPAAWTRATRIRPHRTAATYFFGTGAANVPNTVWGSEGGYYNDVFIDITDVVDKKLAALDVLVSQGYGGAYARKRIETVDGAFGNAGGVAYAEGFISQSAQTYDYLPLSEHTIRRAVTAPTTRTYPSRRIGYRWTDTEKDEFVRGRRTA